ncbi:MAG: hypothetical protein CMP48_02910 [Rickettsiales bacterium]|nr:hypothetical protein [Rickettsiales bacterium]
MDNSLIEKAKKYRSEGYDHGTIRRYLSNEGYEPSSITSALKQMDNEEILMVYGRQKRNEALNKLIISIIITLISMSYALYHFVKTGSVDTWAVAVFVGSIGSAIYHYRLRTEETSTREIFRKPKN